MEGQVVEYFTKIYVSNENINSKYQNHSVIVNVNVNILLLSRVYCYHNLFFLRKS